MPSPTLFLIDDEPISWEQVLGYLESAGQFQALLDEILSQHVITKELQNYPDLIPSDEIAEQLVAEFRRNHNLGDAAVFEAWMQQNDLDDDTLSDTLLQEWTLQQLIQRISQPKLHEYFIKRKPQLDQVYLSCIVAPTEDLARELYAQITEENVPFEQLAQNYSLADNRQQGGKLPPMEREALSDNLRTELDAIQPGELVGPLAVEDRWCLFRLEKIAPASLEGKIAVQLQDELFQQWLEAQMDAMNVEMEVTEWLSL